MDTTRQILSAELENVSEPVAVELPSTESMRRSIRNQRQDRYQDPNPVTRAAIPEIPQDFRQTQYGERFLFFDSRVVDQNRLILFGIEHAIEQLRESSHWFAYGTFKVCPNLFFQVYTLHALENGRSFPYIYGLLSNKTEKNLEQIVAGSWQCSAT